MWFWTISGKRLRLGLVLAAMVALGALRIMTGIESETPVLSYGIAGMKIVVDPGHGGVDSGAIGRKTGVKEKDITLAISKKLARTLSQAGAMVVLTRETDTDLSGTEGDSLLEKKRIDLARRVAMAEEIEADMYLSIHTNADPSPRWHGAQTFYYSKSPEGERLAKCIQAELVRILGNNNRKAKEGVFFIMEKTTMPTLIIEVGFISNPDEEMLLGDDIYQTKIAHGILSGIVKYSAKEVPAE